VENRAANAPKVLAMGPAQIAEFVANYHRAREILEAISEINRELLRRREAL
jgi:hypothetical protein